MDDMMGQTALSPAGAKSTAGVVSTSNPNAHAVAAVPFPASDILS